MAPQPSAATSASSFTALLTALTHPESYLHHPSHVEVVQTHISVVFLAGEEVYKLKKPVKFSFLDYSTLELRRHYCQEEVRLNRRLAPTVYLGVVPVLRVDNGYRVRDALSLHDPTVVDYLVRMRRLPPERKLDTLLSEGRVAKEGVHAVAKRLVHFHQTASTHDAAQYGAPEVVWQAIHDNFQETASFVGETITAKQYDLIQRFSRDFFDSRQELFHQRIAHHRVREGHGDLRCDHIYFLDEGVTIVDCIEFNPGLRTCDVASELAFIAMDLELHGAPSLAAELARAYAVQADDEQLLELLPFYQCYRAYVRGKVESLKSRESEIPPAEQERARQKARRAFRLAARYARPTPRPALLIVCGRVGTGKSTVAQILSAHTGFLVLNSDVIRKRLAGLLPTARATAEYGAGLYTPAFTEQTYAALARQAEAELHDHRGVIVDATFKQPEHRRLFLELGNRFGVPVLFIECRAPASEVERRLRRREAAESSASDATWEIAQREERDFPAFADIPEQHHVIVDTNESVEDTLMEAEEMLFLRNL
jgi:hypothetical protein